MPDRKKDHIELAFSSQTGVNELDDRFYYEPLTSAHPGPEESMNTRFLGKDLKAPIWVSSMTGGTKEAYHINRNLARACAEFGMGMGLGSCRMLLENDKHFEDFNVRDIIGPGLPLYANLGINQVEILLKNKETDNINELVHKLRADGLIIHVNPMQEAFQPEGEKLGQPAIETIAKLVDIVDYNIIVKEVGQGMGPESLKQLLKLPLAAIEFAAFGGTNFAKVELQRASELEQKLYKPFARIGHDAAQMVNYINEQIEIINIVNCRSVIISGGIRSYLDGYYLINKVKLPAIYGQASPFLQYARGDYETLREYVKYQIKGLKLAEAFLKVR
ncbi:MAG: isopentenyl-diphosphate delta-isomerase [Candidatus Kapaibacterium sp.]